MDRNNQEPPSSVVERVFRVLAAFGSDGAPTGLTTLCERSNLPKPTVHRLLQQLIKEGVVERAGSHYRPGLKLFELGTAVAKQQRLREAAIPYMEDLYEALGNSIHLGVIYSLRVLYLEKISGRDRADINTRLGSQKPLHCTGLGKAILAFSPEGLVHEALSRPLVAQTPHTITSADALRAELRQIADEGVAYDREEHMLGVVCVAAPVLDNRGNATVAVSVSGPNDRIALAPCAAAVRAGALGISRALGGVPW